MELQLFVTTQNMEETKNDIENRLGIRILKEYNGILRDKITFKFSVSSSIVIVFLGTPRIRGDFYWSTNHYFLLLRYVFGTEKDYYLHMLRLNKLSKSKGIKYEINELDFRDPNKFHVKVSPPNFRLIESYVSVKSYFNGREYEIELVLKVYNIEVTSQFYEDVFGLISTETLEDADGTLHKYLFSPGLDNFWFRLEQHPNSTINKIEEDVYFKIIVFSDHEFKDLINMLGIGKKYIIRDSDNNFSFGTYIGNIWFHFVCFSEDNYSESR